MLKTNRNYENKIDILFIYLHTSRVEPNEETQHAKNVAMSVLRIIIKKRLAVQGYERVIHTLSV